MVGPISSSTTTCPTATLRVLLGLQGANKVWHLRASADDDSKPARGCVLFFVGDQLEGRGISDEVLVAQEPKTQAAAMAAKWPSWDVLVVMPSRLEAGCSCFDHFLNATTRTGEPLGYQGRLLKASGQLWSLMGQAGCLGEGWREAAVGDAQHPSTLPFPPMAVVGFSKGGVVLNQLLAELGHCFSDEVTAPVENSVSSASGFDWVHPGRSGSAGGGNAPLLSTSPTRDAAGVGLCGGRPVVVPPPLPTDRRMLLRRFLVSVREYHFCDAGLHCRGAFITDPRVTEQLTAAVAANCAPRVVIHGSPRQLDDPTRPWMSTEAKRCISLMKKAGVDAELVRYFGREELSLEMHFRTISSMRAGLGHDM